MKFVNNIGVLEFICVDTANEQKMFLDVDEMKLNVLNFFTVICMSFQHEQPACLKPNCMFYFWKLPHVFVMSFDVFDVFCNKCK